MVKQLVYRIRKKIESNPSDSQFIETLGRGGVFAEKGYLSTFANLLLVCYLLITLFVTHFTYTQIEKNRYYYGGTP